VSAGRARQLSQNLCGYSARGEDCGRH
jgi:hypothetical protein